MFRAHANRIVPEILADAAIDAGRDVQFIEQYRQAADHPVIASYPEGLYLKGFACRVVG